VFSKNPKMQGPREWVCRVRFACATKCALKSVSHIVGVRLLLSALRVAFSAFLLERPRVSGESGVLSPESCGCRLCSSHKVGSQHISSPWIRIREGGDAHIWMLNTKIGAY